METLLFHFETEEQTQTFKAMAKMLNIPFEEKNEDRKKRYKSEFVEMIQRQREDIKNGMYKEISLETLKNISE
jgi:hypothetical protein